MEPLALVERCLDPKSRGPRKNAFCERQGALHVEVFELAGLTVDLRESEFLAQFSAWWS